jgi:hypothetical protein
MTFTCDHCQGDYEARTGTAVAHLFVRDHRCNHLEARCTGCGALEVIFLGPNRLEEAVRVGRLEIRVRAEASSALRVRAERAWAAAEEHAGRTGGREESSSGYGGAELDDRTQNEPGPLLREHPLTPRHERLLESFGETLGSIPDDLLWDAFESDHGREHPERWTD